MMAGIRPPQAEPYPPGVELTSQASPPAYVYFIQQGIVKLTHAAPEGRQMLVDLRFSGELVGVEAAVLGQPCFGTSTTLTRSLLARRSVSEFQRGLARNSKFAAVVNRILSQEMHALYRRLASIGLCGARQRLEEFLAACSDSQTGGVHSPPARVRLPLRQWELAEYLSVSPSYVSRLWRELVEEGVVQRQKGWIYLLDRRSAAAAASQK
jgi:CRP-like cAMP-binding protein